MKKYLGVKVIDAEPMCEGLFEIRNKNCEWNGDRKREGYKVVYEDGYTSWSPKDVFEKAYKEVLIVADEKEQLGLLVNPSNGEWSIVGSVATIELE